MVALAVAQQEIAAGNKVVFIDYEDTVDGVVGRLRSLGITPSEIQEKFIYISPDSPVPDPERLQRLMELHEPSLVVIDGVTEAMTMEGRSINDNQDVASFFDQLPTPLSRCGPAVVLLDHEVKRAQDRNRFALGAEHKLAAVTGAAYRLKRGAPFGIGRTGHSEIRVTKDRPGQIRRRLLDDKSDGLVAILEVSSEGPHPSTCASRRRVYRRQLQRNHLTEMRDRIVQAMGESRSKPRSRSRNGSPGTRRSVRRTKRA